MAFSSRTALFACLAIAQAGTPVMANTVGGELEPGAAEECSLAPPAGPFDVTLQRPLEPPTADRLPDNPGAWSTLILPDSRHRWAPDTGLVYSPDGSLTLHGVVAGPPGDPHGLNVIVLVDYQAVTVEITGWDANRETLLDRTAGSRVRLPVGTEVFGISVPGGARYADAYREVQTLVWPDDGPIDARRWTVYAGTAAPVAVECVMVSKRVPDMPRRSLLDAHGSFVVRTPRATTLAVVPFFGDEPGAPQFLQFSDAGQGTEIDFGPVVDLVAVWESPYSGPAPGWISSFWSVGRVTVDR